MDAWATLKAKQVRLVSLAYGLGCEPECCISREHAEAPTLDMLPLTLWPEWEAEIDKAIAYLETYRVV